MKYNYIAVNDKNRKYKGEMIADTIGEVSKNLQARGLTALSISEAITPSVTPENQSIWNKELGNSDIHNVKIKKKKLLTFCHQMSLMMKSGISLAMAMDIMIDTEKDKNMRKILVEVSGELYNGVPLSTAMGHFRAFPEMVVNLVHAGEANGHLDNAFEQCAHIIEKDIKLSGKVKSAMIYPSILIVVTIAVVIVLSAVVLPQFSELFENFGEDLPAVTKIVMGFSNVLTGYWYLFLLGLAVIIVVIRLILTYNENAAIWWAVVQLKIPAVGNVLRYTYVSRFCRVMSNLSSAGVSILKALELSRNVTSNLYIKDCLNQVIEDVKIGTPINVSMSRYGDVFDSMLVSMIRVGEESGMLDDSLEKMADLFEQQADDSTTRLTELLTPVIIAFIALIVGTVVISIVIPMFTMYDVISKGSTP